VSDSWNPLRRFESGFSVRFPIMPWEVDEGTKHLCSREGLRISRMRVRVWEERRLVRELNERFKTSGATQLLSPAWLSLGYVDTLFLSEDALRGQRSPAQLSHWLDQAEEYLAAAVTQRKFCEGRLESPTAPTWRRVGAGAHRFETRLSLIASSMKPRRGTLAHRAISGLFRSLRGVTKACSLRSRSDAH
jgi:hypothetical protein